PRGVPAAHWHRAALGGAPPGGAGRGARRGPTAPRAVGQDGTMRATVLHGGFDVRLEDVPDPVIVEPTYAIVRVLASCICGSDLWGYRRPGPREGGPARVGHEFVGVVTDVGADVATVRPGDVVIAPFVWSDGTCPNCRAGIFTSCLHGGDWGAPGVDAGQGEAVRVPFADGTLVVAPVAPDDERMPALL